MKRVAKYLLVKYFLCSTDTILMFHPWNTKSHRFQQNALLQGLLARGHHVIGVFPQSSDIRNANYTEIVVHDG